MRLILLLIAGALSLGAQKYNYDGFQDCYAGGCTFHNQYTKMQSNDMTNWTQVNCSLPVAANAPNAIWHHGQWVMAVALAENDALFAYPPTVPSLYQWNIYTAPYYTPGTCPTWTLKVTIDWLASGDIPGLEWCFALTPTILSDNSLHWMIPCTTNPTGADTGFIIYETHPTSSALTAVTAPVPITVTGKNNVIDFGAYQVGSTFYAIYKDETTKYVELATASSFTGTYTPVKTGDWLGIGSGFEGAAFLKVGEKQRLFYDEMATAKIWCMDCTPVSSDVPSGIVSQYQFTEATGATLADHVGANDCAPVASPVKTSTGWTFNRSTQWADCGNPSGLNFSGSDYSISGVFNQASVTFYQALAAKGDGASDAGSQYDILAALNGAAQASTAKFYVGNVRASEPGTHSTGAWHTFAANSVGSTLSIYIDGVQLGSAVQAATTNSVTTHVSIGATAGVANVGALFFDGTIAWMNFRNRGMSDVEVKQDHNAMAAAVAGRGITIATYGVTLDACSYGTKFQWVEAGPFSPLGNTPGLARHGSVRRDPGRPAGVVGQ